MLTKKAKEYAKLTDAQKEARKLAQREWAASNPDKIKEYRQRWLAKNPDRVVAKRARYMDSDARKIYLVKLQLKNAKAKLLRLQIKLFDLKFKGDKKAK